jgi:HK97 gp10 family phage protein
VIQATLVSRIPEIVASLPGEVKDALGVGAENIASVARDNVHVDSGDLRDSIHIEEVDEGWSVVAGDEDVFYGHLEEFGRGGKSGHPFLIPAAESEWATVMEIVEEALEDL